MHACIKNDFHNLCWVFNDSCNSVQSTTSIWYELNKTPTQVTSTHRPQWIGCDIRSCPPEGRAFLPGQARNGMLIGATMMTGRWLLLSQILGADVGVVFYQGYLRVRAGLLVPKINLGWMSKLKHLFFVAFY